jgi:competence protein ComEA
MRRWLESHRELVAGAASTSLVFAILLGAVLFATQRPTPAPIVIRSITPPATPTRAPTATPPPIQVYVSGAVVRPGVYALPWDSRVEQAIAAAGGGTTDADLLRVNLAQRVHDEQQIYVPHENEAVTPVLPTLVPPTPSVGTSSTSGQKVNINTASATELDALPGIGPVLAQRIIDCRQANGPFHRPEDIKNVKGIGDSTFEGLRDLIKVE